MPQRCWVSGQWQPSFGPATVARALRALNPPRPRPARARSTTNNLRSRRVPASRAFGAHHATIVDPDPGNKPRRGMRHESAEPKKSLVAGMEASHARDLATAIGAISCFYPNTPDRRRIDKHLVLDDICRIKPEDLQELNAARDERTEVLRQIRKALGLDWDYRPNTIKESTLAQCEEIVLSELEKGDTLHAGPRTEERMAADIATMTTELVDRLQAEAWRVNEIKAPGAHPKLDSPDSASTMIRLLRSEGYPAYNHPGLDPAETAAQRARLNEVNLQVLSDWAGPYRERYVAKICYNILVCRVPPGIENYNALLLGFALVGEHALAQVVADHLLTQRPTKPTEGTFLSLLQHYRLKNDPIGFHTVIRLLFGNAWRRVGREPTAADYVPDSPDSAGFQAWAATAHKNFNTGLYYRSAPLTHDLAETMIEGFVDFGMCKEGAKMFAVCLAEGWTFDRHLMRRLFHSCIHLADVEASKMIIRALLDHIDHVNLILLNPIGRPRRLARQMRHLLSMCQASSLPSDEGQQRSSGEAQQSSSDDSLQSSSDESQQSSRDDSLQNSSDETQQSSSAGDDIFQTTAKQRDNANLTRLTTAIWLCEQLYFTRGVQRLLRVIRRHLTHDARDAFALSTSTRFDIAHGIFDMATCFPDDEMRKSERVARVARLAWVVAELDASRRRIHAFENQILNAVARNTPRELRAGAHFKRRRSFANRLALALPFVTAGTPQREAALCFVRSKELDARFAAMLIEVLPEAVVRRMREEKEAAGAKARAGLGVGSGGGGDAAAAAAEGGVKEGEEAQVQVQLSLGRVVPHFNQYLVSFQSPVALDPSTARRVRWGRLLKRFGLARLSVWEALRAAGQWEAYKHAGQWEGVGAWEEENAGEGEGLGEEEGTFDGGPGWGWKLLDGRR